MAKRKRDTPPADAKVSKKRKDRKKKSPRLIQKPNEFDLLSKIDDLEYVYDWNAPSSEDVVLVNSDSDDDVVIVTDNEAESGDEKPKASLTSNGNEVNDNKDFIGFGFESSEDERDDGLQSDDGYLSDDQHGSMKTRPDAKHLEFPWVKDHDHLRQKEIADWLTKEMKDFVNFISPSTAEITARNNVVDQLKREITRFWPGTELHVFGSCATDLYLPGSDIDMVVISQTGDYENRQRLYQLSSFLRTKKLAKNIEVIAHAKVPIIKFVDPKTNIHIDISFERINGIVAAKRIRKWLATTPGLRELVLIIKQFLRSRRLNNVHVGGLGGYSTIMLCYHFLKLHPRLSTSSMNVLDNLGSLLIEFFELYGRNFSYDDLIIAVDLETDLPKYLLKRRHPVLNTSRNPFSLVIQDPSDPDNNITRSSYNLRDLKKAFGGAYQLLVDKCYELNGASYKKRLGQSILGDVLRYKGKERDFNDDRDKVINNALINHEEENDESDGANGNDKYYFSDMTDDSDDFHDPEMVGKPEPAKPDEKQQAESRSKISGLMGMESDSDKEDVPALLPRKPSLNKDVKRDYWLKKGLDP